MTCESTVRLCAQTPRLPYLQVSRCKLPTYATTQTRAMAWEIDAMFAIMMGHASHIELMRPEADFVIGIVTKE